jgi:amino acid permease
LAEIAFGSKKWRLWTSLCMMISLLGFTTAYISLFKTLVPSTIMAFVSDEKEAQIPYWLQNNDRANFIWATIFSVFFLYPMAFFRQLSNFRFISFLGVICSAILMVSLIYVFFIDTELVQQPPISNFQDVKYFNISSYNII